MAAYQQPLRPDAAAVSGGTVAGVNPCSRSWQQWPIPLGSRWGPPRDRRPAHSRPPPRWGRRDQRPTARPRRWDPAAAAAAVSQRRPRLPAVVSHPPNGSSPRCQGSGSPTTRCACQKNVRKEYPYCSQKASAAPNSCAASGHRPSTVRIWATLVRAATTHDCSWNRQACASAAWNRARARARWPRTVLVYPRTYRGQHANGNSTPVSWARARWAATVCDRRRSASANWPAISAMTPRWCSRSLTRRANHGRSPTVASVVRACSR